MNFYNDNDPKVCAWTQELINEGLIAPGKVVCKSITEVTKDELKDFTQCHWFNGISGWAHALDLAGWPRTRPVWLASLPCQSFSAAGKGQGFGDDRGNLWFPFLGLVRECRPVTIVGEQVKAAIGHGWLDRIFTDLEAEGYTCGATVLGAHSVGAPHIRQRVYWVANAEHCRHGQERNGAARRGESERYIQHGRPANTEVGGLGANGGAPRDTGHAAQRDEVGRLDNATSARLSSEGQRSELRNERSGECLPGQGRTDGGLGDAGSNERERAERQRPEPGQEEGAGASSGSAIASPSNFWSDAIWHQCTDGKARRISPEPALFPLASRLPGRVGILRGAGNAIVPQVAAHFLRAYLDTINL